MKIGGRKLINIMRQLYSSLLLLTDIDWQRPIVAWSKIHDITPIVIDPVSIVIDPVSIIVTKNYDGPVDQKFTNGLYQFPTSID